MWIYLEHEANCLNADHISRLYVEVTGSGAALKGDLNGKPIMLAYYDNKEAARAALAELIAKREAGVSVFKFGR